MVLETIQFEFQNHTQCTQQKQVPEDKQCTKVGLIMWSVAVESALDVKCHMPSQIPPLIQ